MLDIQIPVSERISFVYAERGCLEADGHAVVLRRETGSVQLPIGSVTAILILPGTVVTHAAVKACAKEGCLLIWIGEGGVRCYSAGNPGRCANALLKQATFFLDPVRRRLVAGRIFRHMFSEDPPDIFTIEQLRGKEGAKVRALYLELASQTGIVWHGRDTTGNSSDPLNGAISFANAALYGLVEAVILAVGYAPSIGYVHTGDPRSFVFDVSDCVKFKTSVPLAMDLYRESTFDLEGRVRRASRDMFLKSKLAGRIISILDGLLSDG